MNAKLKHTASTNSFRNSHTIIQQKHLKFHNVVCVQLHTPCSTHILNIMKAYRHVPEKVRERIQNGKKTQNAKRKPKMSVKSRMKKKRHDEEEQEPICNLQGVIRSQCKQNTYRFTYFSYSGFSLSFASIHFFSPFRKRNDSFTMNSFSCVICLKIESASDM